MVNTWGLQKLARLHQVDLEQEARAFRANKAHHGAFRQHVGWALIGIGAHLALGASGLSGTVLGAAPQSGVLRGTH